MDTVRTLLSANPENNYSKNYARLVLIVTSKSKQHSEQVCIGIHSESNDHKTNSSKNSSHPDDKSTQTLKVMVQQYSCQRVVEPNSVADGYLLGVLARVTLVLF